MIRSVSHSLKFTNKQKLSELNLFISQYTNMTNKFVNIIWNSNKFSSNSTLDNNICKTISTNIKQDSRIRQCAAKQASSIVRGETTKRQKQFYKLKELQNENKNTRYLQRKIDKRLLTKPKIKNLNIELDSRFIDFQPSNKHFDLFIRITQIGDKREIIIPIKFNRCTRKWMKLGKLKNSIRINNESVTLYFEIEEPIKKKIGNIIGADQGKTTCLSLSDNQVTKTNKHGYDLNTIINVLSRRQKGSNGFKRAQEHRKNYINWSINQLNFDNVKQLNLEKIYNIRKGKNSGRKLSHWTYPLIKNKLIRVSEEKGFFLKEQDNKFRSQRCSQCGWVHKSNRKGKTFKCINANCGFATDSDLNAASNHEIELYEIDKNHKVCLEHLNHTTGFFWLNDKIVLSNENIVRYTQKV